MPNEILQHDDDANEMKLTVALGHPTDGPWEVQDGIPVRPAIMVPGIMVVSSALKGKLHFTDTEGAEKGLIALVYACQSDGQYQSGTSSANANLIAAAPTMLAALKNFLDIHHGAGLLDIDVSKLQRALAAARDAIAKAEGRS